jgi:hypothetical protein
VLKSDAENTVKRIEGVGQVESHIEVLPLSNFDDQIRVRTARAIYGYPALSRYALGTHSAHSHRCEERQCDARRRSR